MNLAPNGDFSALEVLALIVALLGTVLYLMVAYILFRRSTKNYEEWVVSFASLTFLFFFLGNFLALLARALISNAAVYTFRIGWIIALAGVCVIPTALLHSYGTYYYRFRKTATFSAPRHPANLLFSLLHLGGVYFFIILLTTKATPIALNWTQIAGNIPTLHFNLFALWLSLGLAAAGILSLKMTAIRRWVRFRTYFYINGVYLLVVAMISLAILWNPDWNWARASLIQLIFLSTALIHGMLLAYFRTQYEFITVFVRPSLVYATLAGLVVLVYHFGIRNLTQFLDQFPAVNVELVELVLLMALVLLFQPTRIRVQSRINDLLFQETHTYRDAVHEVSEKLKSSADLETLLDDIVSQLQTTLEVSHFAIVRAGTPAAEDYTATFALLSSSPEPVIFNHTSHGAVAREFSAAKLEVMLAIREEREVYGLLCVGPKQAAQAVSVGEVHLLRTIANQLAVYMQNAALIEEQLKLERLMLEQEKLSSLGQVAASITHEVKNPLSAVNTLIQVMQEELPRGKTLQKDLQTIEKELAHLNRILTEIVKYAGPPSMDPQMVAVDDVLQDVLVLLKKEAELNNVVLEVDTQTRAQVMATLDGLKEILFNLVFNGIQACTTEGGTVRLETRTRDGQVEIHILDTGSGLPDESVDKIFKPFYTSKPTGTGLGLTIVKEKVARMKGSITARNRLEGGSHFTVTLPVIQNTDNEA